MFEDLISRIDYFEKSLDFLIKDNAWTNKKHKYFKVGGCEHCGKTVNNLQYAHRNPKHENFPEDISGSGRGKNIRVLHFIKHPNKYYLLCPKHHKVYDTKFLGKNPAGFQVNLDQEKRAYLNDMKIKRDKRLLRQQSKLPKQPTSTGGIQ